MGGGSFSRGALYHLLANPIYAGRIRHKDETYPGLHEAIVDADLWQQVQDQLAENRAIRSSRANAAHISPLAGKIFDGAGEPLVPSHANKAGRRYRYYVSKRLVTGGGVLKPRVGGCLRGRSQLQWSGVFAMLKTQVNFSPKIRPIRELCLIAYNALRFAGT